VTDGGSGVTALGIQKSIKIYLVNNRKKKKRKGRRKRRKEEKEEKEEKKEDI